jgi:hypothetical protein
MLYVNVKLIVITAGLMLLLAMRMTTQTTLF